MRTFHYFAGSIYPILHWQMMFSNKLKCTVLSAAAPQQQVAKLSVEEGVNSK